MGYHFLKLVYTLFKWCRIVSFQVKWLLKLSQIQEITEVPSFSSEAQSFLERIIHEFDINDALEVKKIEKVTNHDVKAVEYFLKQRCKSCPEVAKVSFLIFYWLKKCLYLSG